MIQRQTCRSIVQGSGAVAFGILLAALISGCTSDAAEPPEPTSTSATAENAGDLEWEPANVPRVLQRDFQIAYGLEATTVDSTFVGLTTPRGTVPELAVASGATVQSGAPVARLRADEEFRGDLLVGAETSRIDAAALKTLDAASGGQLVAPVAGVVAADCVEATGDAGGGIPAGTDACHEADGSGSMRIVAEGIDLTVPLTGLQQLRLGSAEIIGSATVETVAGPRTVACSHVWVQRDIQEHSAATLHCRVPRLIETVPGLRGHLTITGPLIPNATLVPDAMLGLDDSGYTVRLRDSDGTEKTVPVGVGPSDGVVRVITESAIPIGAELVPPPSAPAATSIQ